LAEAPKDVKSVMTSPVVTVLFSDTVATAADKMVTHDIGAVIVISGGQPVGIMTERDVVKKIVVDGRDAARTPASQVMSKPLITVGPDATIVQAIAIMKDRNIRRLPVVRGTNLVGIVTEKDLIRRLF